MVAPAPGAGDGTPAVEIEAARVAAALGMPVEAFRAEMAAGKVAVLCEKGTGEHAGLYRATFYAGPRRARFIVDAGGRPV